MQLHMLFDDSSSFCILNMVQVAPFPKRTVRSFWKAKGRNPSVSKETSRRMAANPQMVLWPCRPFGSGLHQPPAELMVWLVAVANHSSPSIQRCAYCQGQEVTVAS